MSAKNLQRIELGQNLTLRTIGALAAALAVDPAELLAAVGHPVGGVGPDPLQSLRSAGADPVGPSVAPGPGYVPVLSLQAAAGYLRAPAEIAVLGWCQIPGRRGKAPTGTFLAQVFGDSMQPRIPRGAWCVFGPVGPGSLVGRILLVEHRRLADPDSGGAFGVKRIAAIETLRSGRQRVTLEALNRRYKPVVVEIADEADLLPVASLVRVLGVEEGLPASGARRRR